MPVFTADYLSAVARALIEGVGTPGPIAGRVSEIIVNSNLAGHDSHGVIRIPGYLEQVDQKTLVVGAEPKILRETPATAVMDGCRGWGHVGLDRAMTVAVAKARATGVGAVTLFRCNHTGRVGDYIEAAIRQGCAAMIFAGAGGQGMGVSAPLGGRGRYLGPNPIAAGAPSGDGPPFVVDFATTVVARGKLKVAMSRGEPVPDGWIIDAEGRASIRPEDFFAGGNLLHFGGHKGYALSLLTCVMGGLSGAFDEQGRMGGIFVVAIDVGAFQPIDVYAKSVRRFLDGIKRAPRVDPDREILVPGEPEWRAREARLRDGIDVPESVWAELVQAAATREIALPSGHGVRVG
jgi:uncharacterized oxidoreductase